MGGWMDGLMDGRTDGRTDGAISRLDEWAVVAGLGVGLITAEYRMLPQDAAGYLYRYV